MPSPVSPLTTLAQALKAAPALLGWASVLLGARNLSAQAGPPRVVLFPVEGVIKSPQRNDTALRDVELELGARVWGKDFDQAWECKQRLFQALESQGAAGGLFWKAVSEAWNVDPDASKQGEELEVRFIVILSIDRVALTTGEVDGLSYTEQ